MGARSTPPAYFASVATRTSNRLACQPMSSAGVIDPRNLVPSIGPGSATFWPPPTSQPILHPTYSPPPRLLLLSWVYHGGLVQQLTSGWGFSTPIQEHYSNYPIRNRSCGVLVFDCSNNSIIVGVRMPHALEVKTGQNFQDETGLTVRVGRVDPDDRVHFFVIDDPEIAGLGEMSHLSFANRFERIESVDDACARVKQLGYVAFRRVRLYGEEFELLSDPFPDRDQVAIRATAKGDPSVRTLRLPANIAQGGRAQKVKAA